MPRTAHRSNIASTPDGVFLLRIEGAGYARTIDDLKRAAPKNGGR